MDILGRLIKEKTVKYFLNLDNSYTDKARKKDGKTILTQTYGWKKNKEFIENGLIIRDTNSKNLKNKVYLLTDKGKKLEKELKGIVNLLG